MTGVQTCALPISVKPFKDTLLLPKGEVLKVHEFHASELETLIAFAAAAFAIKERPGEVEGKPVSTLMMVPINFLLR